MSQVNADKKDSIKKIELILIAMPFDAQRRETMHSNEESVDTFNASSRTFTQMESLMVKVHTTQGFIGWGEAFGHKSNPATWAALQEIVGPFFLGRSTDLAETMPAAEHAFHAFGRTGPIHYALSAIDIALWDIAAQRAGQTLREFIEPDARHEVNAYASLVHYSEDPDEVAYHVGRAKEHGFQAVKLHESSTEAIRAARTSLDKAPLMVDVNCRWTLEEATQALAQLAELELLWIEEPIFPPDDSASLTALNARFGNVSAGENHSGQHGLINDMLTGALSFAQPSVGKIGGISAMLRIREAGRTLDVHVIPHCFYYGPALLASAQLVALDPERVLPDGNIRPELEVPFLHWPQQLHLWHAPHQSLLTTEGKIPLPTDPGLGFNPDPHVLERFTLRRSTLRAPSA